MVWRIQNFICCLHVCSCFFQSRCPFKLYHKSSSYSCPCINPFYVFPNQWVSWCRCIHSPTKSKFWNVFVFKKPTFAISLSLFMQCYQTMQYLSCLKIHYLACFKSCSCVKPCNVIIFQTMQYYHTTIIIQSKIK